VGTTLGVSFLVTSVISGLLVAAGEMFYVLLLGMAVLGLSVAHLAFVRLEDQPGDASASGTNPATCHRRRTGSICVARCGSYVAFQDCWP
jgi:DHA3 family multidrug efflux protein-like MFS transporter